MENQIKSKPSLLVRLAVNTLSVFAVAYVLPGVVVDTFWTALWVAVVLGILNATIKPFLIVITIPITFLTLGLFLLVINALIIYFADGLVDGFSVNGFWWALLFSFLITAVNSMLYSFGDN